MSTRCQIGFYAKDGSMAALLYRHSDGYPEGPHGVIAGITPTLRLGMERRGWDPEYLAAWTMYVMIDAYVKANQESAKKAYTHMPADGMTFLGHGIETEFHGDIDYYYAVTPDGVTVYECGGWDESTAAPLVRPVYFKPIRKDAGRARKITGAGFLRVTHLGGLPKALTGTTAALKDTPTPAQRDAAAALVGKVVPASIP